MTDAKRLTKKRPCEMQRKQTQRELAGRPDVVLQVWCNCCGYWEFRNEGKSWFRLRNFS